MSKFTTCDPDVLEQVREIEQRIGMLESQAALLRMERNTIANSAAEKVSELKIGQEVKCRHGKTTRRFRVVGVVGTIYEYDDLPARLLIKYNGIHIKTDGTDGAIEYSIHPLQS